MTRSLKPVLAVASFLALAIPVAAAERVLTLSPGDVTLTFLLEATTHDVHGTFNLKEGEIRFDPATGTASGRVVMDAESTATANDKRDRKMHEKVLETTRFPQFVFTVNRVEGSLAGDGAHDIALIGSIDLHGGLHEITVPAKVETRGSDVTASATVAIPYVAWGLKDPSVAFFRVEKAVDVHVEVKGILHE